MFHWVLILFQGIGIGFNCVAFCCIVSASFWCMLFCPKPNYFAFHGMGYAVYKIEFTSWKTYANLYTCLFPSILFPLKLISCHVYTHEISFQIGINIYHVTFLQCVWIKPHWSSLTNEENLTSNFGQSVQICCREKKKEEKNGNCLVFCVTRKSN